jgi:hypothetical protein
MKLNMIGLFDSLQGLTWVSGLAARLATGAGAQALDARFLPSVAGRRLVAVRTVFGQAYLQAFEPLLQLGHPFLESEDQLDQGAPRQAPQFFSR